MSFSFGEVRALAFKAARGSGLDWGHAEEAAHAVYWLERRGLPGLCAFAEYLKWRSDEATFAQDVDPVVSGTIILDSNDWHTNLPETIFQPLLIIPFLVAVIETDTLKMEWPGTKVLVSRYNVVVDGSEKLAQVVTVSVKVVKEEIPVSTRVTRVPVPSDDCLQTLEQFAVRTYAPATEASRSSGAGAGNDGND